MDILILLKKKYLFCTYDLNCYIFNGYNELYIISTGIGQHTIYAYLYIIF